MKAARLARESAAKVEATSGAQRSEVVHRNTAKVTARSEASCEEATSHRRRSSRRMPRRRQEPAELRSEAKGEHR